MSERTAISWTETVQPDGSVTQGSTWNPLRGVKGNWHCIKISPGCTHCYAARLNTRWGGPDYVVGADTIRLDERALAKPLHWKAPRKIFVCSMTDLFEARVRENWIARIFQVMYRANRHTYQVLTKRPERLAELSQPGRILAGLPDWPHIWCGTSIENDDYTGRADVLRQVPASIRFISAEPLLGPLPSLNLGGIQWVITGGESGPDHRPMHPQWARDIRDACGARGVAYWHKQNGGLTPTSGGHLLDGREYHEFPEVTV
jgi:protein gp37